MKQANNNQWVFWIIGVLLMAIIIAGGYVTYLLVQTSSQQPEFAFVSDEYTGIIEVVPPEPMRDFELVNQAGDTITQADLIGRPALVTFGFTNCPDICPLTLGEMRQIHTSLDEFSDDLQFVFVSVDGERDTPERLAGYFETQRVDSIITGITGNPDDVRLFGQAYGLEFIYNEPTSSGYYDVDHTAGMFLLNSEGQWIRRYAFGTERGRIINDLRNYFSESR